MMTMYSRWERHKHAMCHKGSMILLILWRVELTFAWCPTRIIHFTGRECACCFFLQLSRLLWSRNQGLASWDELKGLTVCQNTCCRQSVPGWTQGSRSQAHWDHPDLLSLQHLYHLCDHNGSHCMARKALDHPSPRSCLCIQKAALFLQAGVPTYTSQSQSSTYSTQLQHIGLLGDCIINLLQHHMWGQTLSFTWKSLRRYSCALYAVLCKFLSRNMGIIFISLKLRR